MANISWKQIDTNGNGYVDGTERISAQVKGAKNVWDGMTELDFQSNTTREQKLALIKKSYNKWDGVIRQNVYVGSNAQEQRAKDKKDKEDELIQLHNKYEKYVSEHAEELAQLDGKMMNPFKALYKAGTANLKELCNEKLNTSFDTTKVRGQLAEHEKATDSYMAIQRQIWDIEEAMNSLVLEIDAL